MSSSPKRKRIRTTTIHDLNDHVLWECFKNLDDRALSEVVDVCSFLRRNALAVLSLRYRQKPIRFCMDHQKPTQFRSMHSILRNIGSFITSLEMVVYPDNSEYSRRLMRTVVLYCGESLNELRLYGITFAADLVPMLEPLLRRLPKLGLSQCRSHANFDPSEMFSLCAELHSLSFFRFHWQHFNLVTIPKLKSLSLKNCNHINNKFIRKFPEVNPQLKEFELNERPRVSSEIFQSIVQYTPQIEKIAIHLFFRSRDHPDNFHIEHVKHLKQLKALKWLKINCQNDSISPVICELVASAVPLKCLSLSHFTANCVLFVAISQLKQLKTLEFSDGTNMNWSYIVKMVERLIEVTDLRIDAVEIGPRPFLEIIRRAPKLQYLQLGTSNRKVALDAKLFMKILAMLAAHNRQHRLEVSLRAGSVNVPQEMLRANRNLLKIDTEDDKRPYTV